jgi:hypothetical protein
MHILYAGVEEVTVERKEERLGGEERVQREQE